MSSTIYKDIEAKTTLMKLYDEKLQSINIEFEERDIDTFAGNTHVVITGNPKGKPVVLFHGINAGAPLTLEAVKGLREDYLLYVVDSIGQTTKSAETRLPFAGDSLAKWIVEVLDELHLTKAIFVGVSYGAFFLNKLLTYYPQRIEKAIYVVPSGFANGEFMPSMKKLSFPLIQFLISKKQSHLLKFMDAFYDTKDEYSQSFHRTTLLGVKMDYRKPLILKTEEALHFDAPVFVMVADNDIFFPGHTTLERGKSIFRNLIDTYILKSSKHMPEADRFPEIVKVLMKWLKS
ncbi:MAG: alpha/beta hydrolase [Saprospiraceae bacterium]